MAVRFPPDRLHVAGVRHLGPGSARSVVAWLDDVQPAVVAVELPSDAASVVPYVLDPATKAPVALYGYRESNGHQSALVPLADFSPEYQALLWAGRHGAVVECIDVSLAQRLAGPRDSGESEQLNAESSCCDEPSSDSCDADSTSDAAQDEWDELYEVESAGPQSFDRIRQAAAEHRDTSPPSDDAAYREAWMRTSLRRTLAAHEGDVAVVCGARHVAGLTQPWPSAAADKRTIGSVSRASAQVALLPWTLAQLATTRPGVAQSDCPAPGWFQHLWENESDTVASWCIHIARALRTAGHHISPGHVIAAVETSTQLASLRGARRVGLREVTDAIVSTFFDGNEDIASFHLDPLIRGTRLGEVCDAAPRNPLEVDLDARCKTLRLKRSPDPSVVTLDLRKPAHRAKSELLQQVSLLGIEWGARGDVASSRGTFQERWETSWTSEHTPKLAEASVWGTTIEEAATVRVLLAALEATLPELTTLYERALHAGLVGCLADVGVAIDRQCVQSSDVVGLLMALPSLVRSARYSDVRDLDSAHLVALVRVMVARVCAGLYAEVRSADDELAREVGAAVADVRDALSVGEDTDLYDMFVAAVGGLVDRADVPGYLVGLSLRIAVDSGVIDDDGMLTRVSKALSTGADAAHKAHFVEGLCSAAPETIATDAALIGALNTWLVSLTPEAFTAVLPYLRRTFGGFPRPSRDAILRTALSTTTTQAVAQHGTSSQAVVDGPQPYDQLATWLGFELVGRELSTSTPEDS